MNGELLAEIVHSLCRPAILSRILLSSFLLLLLIFLSLWTNIEMEKNFLWSFLRGFSQLLLMGSLLLVLFDFDQLWFLYIVLGGMCAFAALTISRRYPYPSMFSIGLIAITTGSLTIMSIVMFSGAPKEVIGIIPYPPRAEYVVTMGSTVISNTMVMTSIVLERIKSDILKERGKIEAALSLGATPSKAVEHIHHDALRAGLLPTTSTVAVLGVVKLPGWMSGMIVGGISPIEAAVYQVIIYLMILSSAFLALLIATLLFTKQFFTSSQQLDLIFLNRLATPEQETE